MRVLTETMVHAIEEVTVEQGVDPREAVLVSGGGAAGFNIVSVAARLGCRRVVIPQTCAGLSATGGLISDVVAEESAAVFTTARRFDAAGVGECPARAPRALRRAPAGAGPRRRGGRVELIVEARYAGQVWELEVPLPPDWIGEGDEVAGRRRGLPPPARGDLRGARRALRRRDRRLARAAAAAARHRRRPRPGGGVGAAGRGRALDLRRARGLDDRAGRRLGAHPLRRPAPRCWSCRAPAIVLDRGAVAMRGASGSIVVAPRSERAAVESEEAVDVA